jgi:hypothetical protein
MEIQLVFQYLFLQRLPQTLRTLLGEQECGNIRTLAALSDRLWTSHKPQHQEVMAVQEPAPGGDGEQQVATVQPKKRQLKKKTSGGASSGNGGILSHAEQARVGSAFASSTSATELKPTDVPRINPATGRETRAPRAA